MSRAFVKENDLEHAGIDIPERPISDEPNYVTPNGLQLLNAQIDALEIEREQLKNKKDDPIAKQKIAIVERDMRYYAARIESAILTSPKEEDHLIVLFGAKVTVEDDEGKLSAYEIVGEDESSNAFDVAPVNAVGRDEAHRRGVHEAIAHADDKKDRKAESEHDRRDPLAPQGLDERVR